METIAKLFMMPLPCGVFLFFFILDAIWKALNSKDK